MPATPLISVVIPTFNRAHCIARAVESVLNQTFTDCEVIVVDDGSTDATTEVLAPFASRIRLLRQANAGVAAARNTGIRAARGRWIAFQDSDDEWHPDKLRRQTECLAKYQAQLCFTRSVTGTGGLVHDIEEIGSTLLEPGVRSVHSLGAIESVCTARIHPYIQTLVIDRRLLDAVRLFDTSLTAAEDTQLLFELAVLACGFLYIDEPLVTINRGTAGSLTHASTVPLAARRYSSYLRVQAGMYWRLVETHPEQARVIRRNLAGFISRRAEVACVAGEKRLARTLAWECFVLAGDLRARLRAAWIYLLPELFRARYRRRWSY